MTFSQAFSDFAESRLHETLIARTIGGHLVEYISRDATAIDAREKPQPKPRRRRKRGRPRKGEEQTKEPSRLERQLTTSLPQMLADLPRACDVGTKRNAKGHTTSRIGYKLHVDTADGAVRISCIMTSASTHDSQAAIPLGTLTAGRVESLYDLMDAAYDSIEIRVHNISLPVPQSPALSSIDLSELPGEVAEAVAQVVDFCRDQARSDPSAETFETVETGLRDAINGLGCKLLGAYAESRDDGASRIERDGQSWFRVAATSKTIMTTLGPVIFRRARYRNGASSTSLVPVDESLGLIDDYLTRPAAQLGLMMMGHCTPREAEEFFAKMGGMTPSVSTLQRLTLSMHERWEGIASETLKSIRAAEDIPPDAVTASVSLDGVMVAPRAGEDGRAEACWREAACGTVSFHDAEGKRLKTLYLGRVPESGKVTLKAQLAGEVAYIRRVRAEIRIGAVADGAADNWTFLESLSPETEVIDFWYACEHLRVAWDHAVAPHWFERHREILRHDLRGVAKVIRALRYLRDTAKGDRAEIERELAFFRKHRHRMRYHALKEEGIAIGSGVVEAACKTLVAQRLKRSGMRWRIAGGRAVLAFRALIKSGLFDRAWTALMGARSRQANDNISPAEDLAIAA